jgi:Plasmid encoded RepA protein
VRNFRYELAHSFPLSRLHVPLVQPPRRSVNIRQETSGNVIVLSEAFQHEISEHPIPVERQVIAARAHAPGLLDFYVWAAWKSWAVRGQPARITIFGSSGLSNQLGTAQYSVDTPFRHKIAQWLRQVKAPRPECPAGASEDRSFLLVCSSAKSAAVGAVE